MDDISIRRINDIIKIALSNDRDEVYDILNAILQIKPDKGNNRFSAQPDVREL